MSHPVLITDFDSTLVPWCFQSEPREPRVGYYQLIDYVQTHQIPWYGTTGRSIEWVLSDPLLTNIRFDGISCKVGTELWLPQDGGYKPCQKFVAWLKSHHRPGLHPYNVDHIKQVVESIVKELDEDGQPIFVGDSGNYCTDLLHGWEFHRPDKLPEYLEKLSKKLELIDCRISCSLGTSHYDFKKPVAIIDILHPRASKASTLHYCETQHPDALLIFAGDSGNDIGAVDPNNPNHRIIVVGNAHDDFRQWVLDTIPAQARFIAPTDMEEADAVMAGLRHFHEKQF